MASNYNTEHFIEQLETKGYTNFLNPYEFNLVKSKISLKKYSIYESYEECTKKIIYLKNNPPLKLLKILFQEEVSHQAVLKMLFSLGLKEETFGDIIIQKNISYIYIIPSIFDDIKLNASFFNNKIIEMNEVPLETLASYKPKFELIELLVSSLRFDTIVAVLSKTSRPNIIAKFQNKEVILNYQVTTKYTKLLQENDIFSIRRLGKYKFAKILKITKKNHYLILLKKYC